MPSNRYDAIVIGGGHNGLVAAAYLARAKKRVVVLERRPLVGGAAVTEEIYPGFKFSVFSYVVSLLRPEIIRDLDLPAHGLQILPLESTVTPLENGDYLAGWGDADETRRELRRVSIVLNGSRAWPTKSLLTMPSLTINCATNVPVRSTTKDGPALAAFTRVAALPGGTLVNDHWNVSGSPSTSDDPAPLRNATCPATTVWSGPALATGAELSVVIVTVSGALVALGSDTMSCAM